MNARRARIRTMLLTVCLLATSLVPISHDTLAQSQSGASVDSRAMMQVRFCSSMGGDSSIALDESGVISVVCVGGLLDGMWCENTLDFSSCTMTLVRPDESPNVMPEAGIEVAPQEPVESLETLPRDNPDWGCLLIKIGCHPRLAEAPTMAEAVIIPNLSAAPVEDTALIQINGCRAVGGDAQISMEGTTVTVVCVGGVVDGLWCLNDSGATLCTLLPIVPLSDEVQGSPVEGIEAVDNEPPTVPTTAATDVPLVPTTVPTEIPTEPPVVPTEAPLPTRNDNALPPGGGAEDPTRNEPTPTPPPLQ